MMSTETRYSPPGSYAKYAYGYLSSLLGFILLVIGENLPETNLSYLLCNIFSPLLRPHWAR